MCIQLQICKLELGLHLTTSLTTQFMEMRLHTLRLYMLLVANGTTEIIKCIIIHMGAQLTIIILL